MSSAQAGSFKPAGSIAPALSPQLAVSPEPIGELADLAGLLTIGEVCVLSGAGLSTESGIPDYRGATGRARPASPMTYQHFIGSHAARQRYWARSHAGWRTIVDAAPNAGHRQVAALQRAGLVTGIITQNVDGLHQAAGASDVVELHGGLDRVVCLDCAAITPRSELDARLRAANPDLEATADIADVVKPDGDVDLDEDVIQSFRTVDCLDCGRGMLKPDVVFFGEFVPPERVTSSYALVAGCKALLVLGSSLTVASGFRFVRRAVDLGIPVAIVNDGPTRGDKYASVRLSGQLGQVLSTASRLALETLDPIGVL